jgi:hypothetical protein
MVDYKEIINTKPLGSIERLDLIASYGKEEQSEASKRCILKRIRKMNKHYEYKRQNFKNN